jgi:ACR3 family arsenite transporter
MVVGGLIGNFIPSIAEALARAEFAKINAIVAVLLWIMIFPMLVQIDFYSILRVREAPAAIALTSVVNYLVKPFSMYALALLFFRVAYTAAIPDAALRDSYIAGLILLAGAPCTAMVFVWSLLLGGDGAYTLVQVAFNDLLMLVLYVPTAVLLIGVSDIELPWETIVLAVVLFIVAPLVIAAVVRVAVLRLRGEAFLRDKVVAPFKPLTIVALLAVLVLIFIFQGRTIAEKPLHILLLAVPIILQVLFNFVVTYFIGYRACIEHEKLGPASLIATSNFFELAVAVAISVYGLDSGAALATVVGVLVEVPVMLGLVHVCNYLRPRLERRIAAEGKGGAGKVWCGGGGGSSGRRVGPVGPPPVSDDTTAIERV